MAETPSGAPAAKSDQALLVAIAWLYVGIPLAWGVTQTVIKCVPLFR